AGRVVNSITGANGGPAVPEHDVSEAEAGREIGPDGGRHSAGNAGIARKEQAERSGFEALRLDAKFECSQSIVPAGVRRIHFPAQTEIQREAAGYFPIVLDKQAGVDGAEVAIQAVVLAERVRIPKQKIRESVLGEGAGEADLAGTEPVARFHKLVPLVEAACFDTVPAVDPRNRVAEHFGALRHGVVAVGAGLKIAGEEDLRRP